MLGFRFSRRLLSIVSACSLTAALLCVERALAIEPTIDAPIKWLGGVSEITILNTTNGLLYAVPAGRNFMLTDLIVSNPHSGVGFFRLYTGSLGQCVLPDAVKLDGVVIPPMNSLVIPLNTGVGFASGQMVCVTFASEPAFLSFTVNARGYLFGPK